jgi:hypothetical protein
VTGCGAVTCKVPLTRGSTMMVLPLMPPMALTTAPISALTKFRVIFSAAAPAAKAA